MENFAGNVGEVGVPNRKRAVIDSPDTSEQKGGDEDRGQPSAQVLTSTISSTPKLLGGKALDDEIIVLDDDTPP